MNQVAVIDHVPAAPVQEGQTLLAVISRAAADPQTDVEKMERLMAMYERVEAKRAETDFNAAMSRAQTAMRPIQADMNNPQTRSLYASYAKLDSRLRPIYTANGFALSFDTEAAAVPEYIRVLCYVTHKDGHSRTYKVDMPADGKGAKGGDVMTKTHATGAGMTYGMRYLLKMIFNVAVGEDDTDGNQPVDPIPEKDAAWIAKVNKLDEYPAYTAMKAEMMADYGGVANNIPHPVRDAFNVIAAKTKPKD